MWNILRQELNIMLHSVIAYAVLVVFLLSTWLVVWLFPDTNVLDYGYADLSVFFTFVPYLFIFLVPALTMRSFAEEQKMGDALPPADGPCEGTGDRVGKISCLHDAACTVLVVVVFLSCGALLHSRAYGQY